MVEIQTTGLIVVELTNVVKPVYRDHPRNQGGNGFYSQLVFIHKANFVEIGHLTDGLCTEVVGKAGLITQSYSRFWIELVSLLCIRSYLRDIQNACGK